MDISVIEDAKQRIEKVVTEYRNDGTRSQFTMETKPEYKTKPEIFWLGIVVTIMMIFSFIDADSETGRLFAGSLGGCAFVFVILVAYTNSSERYKYKHWHNDDICETDIFYLCENAALKKCIRKHIEDGHCFTYTILDTQKYFWLGEIEGERQKAEREALVKKIDAVEPHCAPTVAGLPVATDNQTQEG